MQMLNSPWLALIGITVLIWLGWQSYPREAAYSAASVEAVNNLVPVTLQQRQAAALREIYHLTDADIAKPVNIFKSQH